MMMKEKFFIVADGVIYCGSNSKTALQKVLDTFMSIDPIYSYYLVADKDLKTTDIRSSKYFTVVDDAE